MRMVDRRRPEEGEEKPRVRELLEDPGDNLMIRRQRMEGWKMEKRQKDGVRKGESRSSVSQGQALTRWSRRTM